MKVYRVEIMIVTYDNVGAEIADVITNARYPNHGISPQIVSLECEDIGVWDDKHPLNQRGWLEEYHKLFPKSSTTDHPAEIAHLTVELETLRGTQDARIAAYVANRMEKIKEENAELHTLIVREVCAALAKESCGKCRESGAYPDAIPEPARQIVAEDLKPGVTNYPGEWVHRCKTSNTCDGNPAYVFIRCLAHGVYEFQRQTLGGKDKGESE